MMAYQPLTWNKAKKLTIPDHDLKELHNYGFDLAQKKPIASGVSGVVFKGKCNKLAKRKLLSSDQKQVIGEEPLTGLCAIKMCESELRKGQLQEEALRLEQLRHPNISEVYLNMKSGPHHVSKQWRRYFVMEFLDGGTLADRLSLSQRQFSESEAIHMFGQLIDGLHYLHSNGVLHIDLHAGNIMLTKDPHQKKRIIYKIVDFGSSVVMGNMRGMDMMLTLDITNLSSHFIRTLSISKFKDLNMKTRLRVMCDLINEDVLKTMADIRSHFNDILNMD